MLDHTSFQNLMVGLIDLHFTNWLVYWCGSGWFLNRFKLFTSYLVWFLRSGHALFFASPLLFCYCRKVPLASPCSRDWLKKDRYWVTWFNSRSLSTTSEGSQRYTEKKCDQPERVKTSNTGRFIVRQRAFYFSACTSVNKLIRSYRQNSTNTWLNLSQCSHVIESFYPSASVSTALIVRLYCKKWRL